MVIRDLDGFEAVDAILYGLGQSVTTTINAPGAPGSGIQSIPIVQLGPVQVMGKNGGSIPVVNATIRTSSRVVSSISAPAGIFQTTIDQSDLDAGAIVIFSASGYLSTTVQAIGLVCNRGTRNEMNQVVSMSAQACTPQTFFLDPVQAQIPQYSTPAYNPTYGQPAPYGPVNPYGYAVPPAGYGYPAPPPGYNPSSGNYSSAYIPVDDEPRRRPPPRKRPTRDETVPSHPHSAPENQAVPAPPAAGIYALGGDINPWYLAGGSVALIGAFIWLMKS